MHIDVKDIVKIARSWINTPYKHQGRTKNGCDCLGIPLAIAKELKIDVKDFKGYGRLPKPEMLLDNCRKHMIEIENKKFIEGDIALMTWGKDKTKPHHFAIIVNMFDGSPGIIHGHTIVGKVVEHALDDKWKSRITHIFRIPNLIR